MLGALCGSAQMAGMETWEAWGGREVGSLMFLEAKTRHCLSREYRKSGRLGTEECFYYSPILSNDFACTHTERIFYAIFLVPFY